MSKFENLNKRILEIHSYAKEKGWWDTDRSAKSLYALFHSEISEAVEEARKPVFNDIALLDMYYWSQAGEPGLPVSEYVPRAVHHVNADLMNPDINPKPEGVGVELIDMVIRVLDYMGSQDMQFNQFEYDVQVGAHISDLSYFSEMHQHLSLAMGYMEDGMYVEEEEHLGKTIELVERYFDNLGWDFWKIFDTKHQYNTTRERRHGNKKF